MCKVYRIFGLNIASEFALPKVLEVKDEAQVFVKKGRVPKNLGDSCVRGARYEITKDQYLLHVDNIARYYCLEGREIIVAPEPDANEEEVLLFLWGSAIAAILHQRGLVPIHASAIEHNGKAILFSGNSGAGKSTTVMNFHLKGYPLLADDIAVITWSEEGVPLVQSGLPQSKLWADALNGLGSCNKDLERVRPGLNKYLVEIENGFVKEALPLDRIYYINTGNEPKYKIEVILGFEKFNALKKNIFRPGIFNEIGTQLENFKKCEPIVQKVLMKSLTRPLNYLKPNELVNLLEEDFYKQ
ncbi:hypothetical protein [Labilibaculum euxinus]